jgi:outer membrane protein assembly factor BamB
MEYDRHRTRWPHILLFLIYVGVVVYLLMSNNKYLYSHRELRLALAGERLESVAPVPKISGEPPALGEPTYWSRGTPERTGHDGTGTTRDKDFVAEWNKIVVEEGAPNEISSWASDDSGVYLTGSGPWAYAFDLEGNQRWRFRFAKRDTERGMLDPVLDDKQIYFTQPAGQIIALDKITGGLRWKLALAEEILTTPLIINDELWLVVKPLESERQRLEDKQDGALKSTKKPKAPNQAQYRFAKLNRKTGELRGYSDLFAAKTPTHLTWDRSEKQILIVSDNKLSALTIEDGKIASTQTLPDAIQGPAVAAAGKVFVALTSGKIQAWDLSKKGKFEWELEIAGTPQSAPTYIPTYDRLAVMTDDGQFHMVDLKKSEYLWKFSLDNRNPSHEIMAARLSGRHIENLGMKWEKKGWTAWAPCSDNRICIYNPDKGQLLARVPANGAVISPPLFVGKNFFLVTTEKSGDGRRFRLTHFMDEDAFKKKTKEAAEAAAKEAEKEKSGGSSI